MCFSLKLWNESINNYLKNFSLYFLICWIMIDKTHITKALWGLNFWSIRNSWDLKVWGFYFEITRNTKNGWEEEN